MTYFFLVMLGLLLSFCHRHETPFSPSWEPIFEPRDSTRRHLRPRPQEAPENVMQALMETKPHGEVPTAKEETAWMRERIVLAMDALEDRDRWIVEAIIFRKKSVREVAVELNLSKTHVHRLWVAAVKSLQLQLEDLI